jgi:hypothetical protein
VNERLKALIAGYWYRFMVAGSSSSSKKMVTAMNDDDDYKKGGGGRRMLRHGCQYLTSFVVVCLAILVGWIVRTGHQTFGVELPAIGTTNTLVRSLTTDEIVDYQRDGTVLARGLLTTDQTNALRKAIQSAPSPSGTIFDLFSRRSFETIRFDLWRTDPTVATYALLGLPAIAASVFYNNDDSAGAGKKKNGPNGAAGAEGDDHDAPHLRLLRDAYFSYVPGGRGCGWHVDDEAFWPTLNDTSGVTIWIALDDITEHGGGLLVANRTKFVNDEPDFLPHCRAQSRARTCDMETLAPECHEKLEQTAIRSWGNLKAGDAIIWDRWVFHRTVPTTNTNDADDGASSSSLPLRRYSIRFIPDNAKAFGAIHTSVEQEGSFVGSPYYPQVWPHLLSAEVEALRRGQLDMTDVTLLNLFRNLGRFLYRRAVDALIDVHTTSSSTTSRSGGGGTTEQKNPEKESSS